jgi:hypothetical protein
MSVTTQIPRDRLAEYFDAFTKRYLRQGSPELADIEAISREWGDQPAVQGARLMGITYDTGDNSLEIELESGDHRIYQPAEVWVVEEPDGFVSSVEVVRRDGTRDIVNLKRVGAQRR